MKGSEFKKKKHGMDIRQRGKLRQILDFEKTSTNREGAKIKIKSADSKIETWESFNKYFVCNPQMKKGKGSGEASTNENVNATERLLGALARLPRALCAPARLSTLRCDA